MFRVAYGQVALDEVKAHLVGSEEAAIPSAAAMSEIEMVEQEHVVRRLRELVEERQRAQRHVQRTPARTYRHPHAQLTPLVRFDLPSVRGSLRTRRFTAPGSNVAVGSAQASFGAR